ncbi:MAG: fructosamine kinase family protein [Gammaproteobacteria bacterium]|nr:fructosamine kinase family protein [Gammaproteobacteria bacterium]MDH5801567.1 fructosamine kinase family protein [Gammaproteobacteria bacterium]
MDLLLKHISEVLGREFTPSRQQGVSGGCINNALMLADAETQLFVKTNGPGTLSMFEAEMDGLNEIAQSGTIRVPEPLCCGVGDGQAYLVMEYVPLTKGSTNSEQLATDLAAMHQIHQSQFGWFRDNTIGATPQINAYENRWVDFWRDKRLAFQLQLAAKKGYSGALQSKGERLLDQLAGFFSTYTPQASLLHGDLWSGNYAYDSQGNALIFDPAVYYGDRETDLAMTELFGGFSADFYRVYNEILPLDSGYKTRKTLYNLYHILNHLNLFGGAYLGQAQRMIEQLLSELA